MTAYKISCSHQTSILPFDGEGYSDEELKVCDDAVIHMIPFILVRDALLRNLQTYQMFVSEDVSPCGRAMFMLTVDGEFTSRWDGERSAISDYWYGVLKAVGQ